MNKAECHDLLRPRNVPPSAAERICAASPVTSESFACAKEPGAGASCACGRNARGSRVAPPASGSTSSTTPSTATTRTSSPAAIGVARFVRARHRRVADSAPRRRASTPTSATPISPINSSRPIVGVEKRHRTIAVMPESMNSTRAAAHEHEHPPRGIERATPAVQPDRARDERGAADERPRSEPAGLHVDREAEHADNSSAIAHGCTGRCEKPKHAADERDARRRTPAMPTPAVKNSNRSARARRRTGSTRPTACRACARAAGRGRACGSGRLGSPAPAVRAHADTSTCRMRTSPLRSTAPLPSSADDELADRRLVPVDDTVARRRFARQPTIEDRATLCCDRCGATRSASHLAESGPDVVEVDRMTRTDVRARRDRRRIGGRARAARSRTARVGHPTDRPTPRPEPATA